MGSGSEDLSTYLAKCVEHLSAFSDNFNVETEDFHLSRSSNSIGDSSCGQISQKI